MDCGWVGQVEGFEGNWQSCFLTWMVVSGVITLFIYLYMSFMEFSISLLHFIVKGL